MAHPSIELTLFAFRVNDYVKRYALSDQDGRTELIDAIGAAGDRVVEAIDKRIDKKIEAALKEAAM